MSRLVQMPLLHKRSAVGKRHTPQPKVGKPRDSTELAEVRGVRPPSCQSLSLSSIRPSSTDRRARRARPTFALNQNVPTQRNGYTHTLGFCSRRRPGRRYSRAPYARRRHPRDHRHLHPRCRTRHRPRIFRRRSQHGRCHHPDL